MENRTKTPNINEGTYSKHKHTLMMVLGCVMPLVLLGILWFAGVSQNILSFGIILLCPIMHLIMMKNMKHDTHNIENKKESENKQEEPA